MNSSAQPGSSIVMIALGGLFIFMGFFAIGARGAFGRGPTNPITTAGRVIMVLAGLLLGGVGLYRVLR
jgi:hypothetical protein